MSSHSSLWLTIALAAALTYSLRLGGLLLADRLPKSGRFRMFMDALPGTILLSLVVPAALASGPWGWFATACAAVCGSRSGNVLAAMLVGVLIMAAGRFVSATM